MAGSSVSDSGYGRCVSVGDCGPCRLCHRRIRICCDQLAHSARPRSQPVNKPGNTRRETLYGDFIDQSSQLFTDALTHTLDDPSKLVVIYGIIVK